MGNFPAVKTAVILDGFHKGYQIKMSTLYPQIKVPKPPTKIACGCNPMSDEEFVNPPGDIVYTVAFRSADGQIALYSKNGNSSAILEGRSWITQNLDNQPIQPLFFDRTFDCHEDKAWEYADPDPNPLMRMP